MKTVAVLGSTGSIGRSTLDLISKHKDRFDVKLLSAHKNYKLLAQQALEFQPEAIVIGDESLLPDLRDLLKGTSIAIEAGEAALQNASAESVDISVVAIVGFAGLRPVLSAIRNAKAVAIANKEPLVAAGHLVMEVARESGCKILPTDSEHNAIFQVFEDRNRHAIERLILTASGGPFRTWGKADIEKATPQQAVNHPNWSMGAKISVDSASLMNKALEVIEAYHLFAMPADKIDVVVHPQSIIHSCVEYNDGSILAQMGAPDMRTPIAYCLSWPDRIETSGERLDFLKLRQLDFEELRHDVFPSIKWAYQALESGTAACVALNASNELAVEAFLNKRIEFSSIYATIKDMLDKFSTKDAKSLEDIIALDKDVRKASHDFIYK